MVGCYDSMDWASLWQWKGYVGGQCSAWVHLFWVNDRGVKGMNTGGQKCSTDGMWCESRQICFAKELNEVILACLPFVKNLELT